MSLLEIHKIDAFHGDVQVIYEMSLRVDKGEVVSIIGGNGAGKSTLLRVISGLMIPTAGRISFHGTDIHTEPPENIVTHGIVHVPEGRRLFPLMSVKDNLLVGAYNKRHLRDGAENRRPGHDRADGRAGRPPFAQPQRPRLCP
jgi:branched-chain amino acid transport system ATP-binding protein